MKRRSLGGFCPAIPGFLILVALASIAVGQMPAPTQKANFADGTRLSFLGDSISENGHYPAWVEYFFRCRSGKRIVTWNCGVGGDNAGRALQRLEREVALTKPDVVCVMFGMNDCNRHLFAPGATVEFRESETRNRLKAYAANLNALAVSLKERNVRMIILAPTPFEHANFLKSPNFPGVDEALGEFAGKASEFAGAQGLAFVDTHGEMNRLNRELQALAAENTLISQDRIHPGNLGQLAIASIIARDLGFGPIRQSLTIDVESRKADSENVTVSAVTFDRGGVEFSVRFSALPVIFPSFPVPEEFLTGLHKAVANDRIALQNLSPGNYRFFCEGRDCGVFTMEELEKGLELDKLPLFPTTLASKRLKELIFRKRNLQSEYRQIVWCEFLVSEQKPGPLTPQETVEELKRLQESRPYMKASVDSRLANYERLKADETGLLHRIRAAEQEIDEVLFPLNVHCAVVPAGS